MKEQIIQVVRPKQLYDGTLGASYRTPTVPVIGDLVEVQTRGGKSWKATIMKQLAL